MFIDQSENAADSQSTDDRPKNFQIFAGSRPDYNKDNDCAYDNHKVKSIPAIVKVIFAICRDFNDSLCCENEHEQVIYNFDRCFIIFRLHVPTEGQNERISQNTVHDEFVE